MMVNNGFGCEKTKNVRKCDISHLQTFLHILHNALCLNVINFSAGPAKNIATGETLQAITPFHFFDNFNFYH